MLEYEITHAGSSYWSDWNLRPYNPSELYQKSGDYTVFDEMLEDDQISSILTLKKYLILNSDYEIQCEKQNIVDFLNEMFEKHFNGIFIKKIYDILSAMDYGFSITEKIYKKTKTAQGEKIILYDLKTRAPHSFEFYCDDFGNLNYILQHIDNSSDIKLENKIIDKFIIYTYNKKFDNFYGESELNKGVYRAWWSKNAIIKFWNIRLERFGMPTVVGKMPRSGGVPEKNRFKDILKNIQSRTGITIPDDFSLEILEASKGAAEYENAINKYDTMIARKMLIPDLLGLSGEKTGGGSYSLGEKQFDLFFAAVVKPNRMQVENVINKEIIKPIIEFNFGNNINVTWKFVEVDAQKKSEDLKIWLDAIKSGKIPITNEQINWFLQNVNAPEIEEKELIEIEEKKEEIVNKINGGNEDGLQQEKGEKEEINEKDEKQEEKNFAQFYRELSDHEKEINFSQLENNLNELENKYKKELTDIFHLILNGALSDIKSKKIIEKKKLSFVNDFKLRNISQLRNLFKKMLKDGFELGQNSVQIRKFAIADTGLIEDEMIKYLNEKAFYITGVEEEEILKKIKGILISGIEQGIGVQELVKSIDAIMIDYDFREKKSERLETIVRTNIIDAYSQARNKQFDLINNEIIGYEFSAIMDGRTSEICLRLDGKIIKASEREFYTPPLHFKCRSLLIPLFKFEYENKKFEPSNITGIIRDKKYPSFLKIENEK